MKVAAQLIILITLLSISFISCSHTPNELKVAEQIMEEHPDSALHILQKISPEKYSSDANRALYGILLYQALDKNYMSLQPDSLINFSIDYYQKQNNKVRLGMCHLYKGRSYQNKYKYELAASEYLKALDDLKAESDYNILGEIYSNIGLICSYQQQYKEAREKYQQAVNYFEKAQNQNALFHSILDIGATYRCTQEYKIALKYCYKAISKTKDSILLGEAYQEIGSIYKVTKQPNFAIHYLKMSLQQPAKGINSAVRNYLLAGTYIDKSQNDSAEFYIKKSLKQPANFTTRRGCYEILVNTTFLKGNLELMGKYMSKYQDYSDSIRTIESQTKATVIEDLHNNSIETSGAKSNLTITILLLIIVGLIGGGLFYYFYKRSMIKKQELKNYKIELNSKQAFVSKSISKKIEDSKAIHAATRKHALPSDRIKLDKEVYNYCLHINNWEVFAFEMNHAFSNIVDKLQTKQPTLSHKEINWCCLHLLNVSNADRILLLETTTEGLYKMKQRIAQKLNLKSTKDLNSFLKEIITTSH